MCVYALALTTHLSYTAFSTYSTFLPLTRNKFSSCLKRSFLRCSKVLRSTKGSSLLWVRCFAVWLEVPKAEVWIQKCLTHIPSEWTQTGSGPKTAIKLRHYAKYSHSRQRSGFECLSLGWWIRDSAGPSSNFWTPYSDSYDLHPCPSRDGQC
jgi:hypothetical protein